MGKEKQAAHLSSESMPPRTFFILSGVIISIASFLRLAWLELKPFHHDEGVNGSFLNTLFNEGIYKYDPANYHGPDLYYISLFVTRLVGLDDFGVRFSVAIFGILTVALAFVLRREMGDRGALFTAALLTVSPGMVFFSRYFIHEMLFVFFTMAIPISMLFFIQRRRAGLIAQGVFATVLAISIIPVFRELTGRLAGAIVPDFQSHAQLGAIIIGSGLVYLILTLVAKKGDGHEIFLILAFASAAMLFLTKETAFITIGTMLIACVSVRVWELIFGARNVKHGGVGDIEPSIAALKTAVGGKKVTVVLILSSATVFLLLWIVFFSSFFTNPDGLRNSLEAYKIWTKTGTDAHTMNGFWAYFGWGMKIEGAIFILSFIGTAVILFTRTDRFAIFCAFWSNGILLAYTLIPYKTPWLMISFVLPMTIVAGFLFDSLGRSRIPLNNALAWLAALISIPILSAQAWSLNFEDFDDEKIPYIYAHSYRDLDEMLKQIKKVNDRVENKEGFAILIASSEFWPLPWNLREFPRTSYPGTTVDAQNAEIVVLREGENTEAAIALYAGKYADAGIYRLRPGVTFRLLVRTDLADPEMNTFGLDLFAR